MGRELFSTLYVGHLRRLAHRIQQRVPAILHICGDITDFAGSVKDCGFTGVSVDSLVSLERLRGLMPSTAIMGNLSIEGELSESLAAQLKRLITHRPHIFAPSCGIAEPASLKRLLMAKRILFSA